MISILIVSPSASMIPNTAAMPSDLNNNNNQANNQNSFKTDSSHPNQGKNYKALLDSYPDTTPMQEKIKKAIDIMKNGDPKKRKDNPDTIAG